ncbi:hypothetical protein ACIPCA_12725 [Flavobacterium covae]|uniref:Uncharacterized protein n=1 Tax=Flavobacterium columnare TaxID=996 RepID=A0A8G0KS39_9FLAO|nr:hypothetical protein [Flavobacterium davisii]QYS89167.1 hypothetical protein JJC05_01705 [Flavobacterium davisii]
MEAFSRAVALEVTKHLKAVTSLGIVESVQDNTCTVKREGRADLLDVRFSALEQKKESFIQVIPKINSQVILLEIENQPSETLIVGYSEIERIETKVGSISLKLENDKLEVFDGKNSLGSLLDDLIANINNLKITTPNGIGTVSPDSKLLIEALKEKFKNLLK